MRVIVDRLIGHEGLVLAASPVGMILAYWRGDGLPAKGEYNVELEIDKVTSWEIGSSLDLNVNPLDKKTNYIVASVNMITDDILNLRIADSLVSIERSAFPSGHLKTGDLITLSIKPRDLDFCPYEL